jgi:hypothetical protein
MPVYNVIIVKVIFILLNRFSFFKFDVPNIIDRSHAREVS